LGDFPANALVFCCKGKLWFEESSQGKLKEENE